MTAVAKTGPAVVAAVLAGGSARRMGGGVKALADLAGRPLLEHVLERIRPQVDEVVIAGGHHAHRLGGFGVPVIGDSALADGPSPGSAGPLAGLHAALGWVASRFPLCEWVASVPVDTPFLPADLVTRLREAAERSGAAGACAASDGRLHPVVGLWRPALANDLEDALARGGVRRAGDWVGRVGCVVVEFSAAASDPFFNVNRPEDVEAASRIAGASDQPGRPSTRGAARMGP